MKQQMNLLEKESLYLVTVKLLDCDAQTDSYSLNKAVTELRDCYWSNGCVDTDIHATIADINTTSVKLKRIEKTLSETIACLDAIVNSIENRVYDESQS